MCGLIDPRHKIDVRRFVARLLQRKYPWTIKKITGYRDLTQSEIDGMNSIKALEADAGKLFKQIGQIEGVDQRTLALAKTNLQQGFMWFVRSIAKPADPFS